MKSVLVENEWHHLIIRGTLSNQHIFHGRDLLWSLTDLKVLMNEIYVHPMKLQFYFYNKTNLGLGAGNDLGCNSGVP